MEILLKLVKLGCVICILNLMKDKEIIHTDGIYIHNLYHRAGKERSDQTILWINYCLFFLVKIRVVLSSRNYDTICTMSFCRVSELLFAEINNVQSD